MARVLAMTHRLAMALGVASMLGMVGCGDGGPAAPTDPGGDAPVTEVTFADSGLQAAVRAALEVGAGAIDADRAAHLDRLDATGRGIGTLEGIAQLEGLQVLLLGDNRIADLAPLATMTHLQALSLENNRVVDVTPLAGLTQLKMLLLDNNAVTDISPLLPLTGLESVGLGGNPLGAEGSNTVAALRGRGVAVDYQASEDGDETPGGGGATALPPESDWRLICASYWWMESLLYSLRPGEGDLVPLTDPGGHISIAAVSPDGTVLVYDRWQDELENRDIYLQDAATGLVTRLTTDAGPDVAPAWSPDGSRIAYIHRDDGGGIADIFLMSPLGGAIDQLTQDAEREGTVTWSPDGTRIAYSADLEGDCDIRVMDIEDRSVTPLTSGPLLETQPAWSPDGQTIAFVRGDSESQGLFLMEAGGGDPRVMRDEPNNECCPVWSPDGQRLAFGVQRADRSGHDVWVMDAAPGAPAEQVTAVAGTTYPVAWVAALDPEFERPEERAESPFVDANLDKVVRLAIGVGTEGEITASALLEVEELTAWNRGIEDLTGVELMTHLTHLDLSNRTVSRDSDYSLVDTAASVQAFGAWNRVRDISPLKGLTSLVELEVARNPVEDLAPLSGLANLRRLSVAAPQEDLSALAGLTSLTHLTIGGGRLTDISALAGMPSLATLYIHETPLSDMSPLAALQELSYLSVRRCHVQDVSPLAAMGSLVWLDLTHNRIEDIAALVGMRLSTLTLTGNPLNAASVNEHIPAVQAGGVRVEY